MRAFIVDNHSHVLAAMHFLLEQQPGLQVVGTAETPEGLSAQIRQAAPDLLLISWELWRGPGAPFGEAICALTVPPLVLVFGSRPEVQQAALASGADAYFCTYDPPPVLLAVVRTMAARAGQRAPGDA